MGVHIREPLIRAEWKTSRGRESLLSGDLGWTGLGVEGRNDKYQETIRWRKKEKNSGDNCYQVGEG